MKYRNSFLKISLAIVLVFLFEKSPAQTVLPLDSILNRIGRNHPALKAPDARIRELDAIAKGAITMPPPRISSGFWTTPYNPKFWREQGVQGDGMGMIMLSAEQMLPNRGMQKAEQRYMASMSGMQTAEKGVLQNMLFSEAKSAFYNWGVLKKKTAVLEQSKDLLRLMIGSAKERYQYNREKLGSIYKAETEMADLDRMQALYAGEMRQQKTLLEALMQFPHETDFELDTAYFPFSLADLPMLPDTSRIAVRSDIQAIGQNLRIARFEQEWQRSRLKPEFGIRFDHMIGLGGQPMQFSLMGMITAPIAPWANKDIKARIEAIDYRLAAFEWEKAALANQIRGALADRLVMMQTLQNQISRYENDIVPNQRKRFQSTLLAYEQNTEDLFMVLDAWLQLKMSRLAQLDLLQQFLQAKVAYEKELEIR